MSETRMRCSDALQVCLVAQMVAEHFFRKGKRNAVIFRLEMPLFTVVMQNPH